MHTSYARYKCMGALYYKLAAFIPNTKDVWDFCLGGLKIKIKMAPLVTPTKKPIQIKSVISLLFVKIEISVWKI
ncbi:hypothetical protein JP0113_06500 [Helicobacter pylori]|nr:hypothetical protein JP0113_06500 [Helicobacter pylori]